MTLANSFCDVAFFSALAPSPMFMFEISEPLGWVKPNLLLLGFCFGIRGNLGKDMQFEIPLKDQIVLCYFSLLKFVLPNLPRCSVLFVCLF